MNLLRCFIAYCLFLISVEKSLGASYSWTGNGGDHLWSNPRNWVPTNGPPASGDTVSINAYQVQLDSTLTLSGLNLASTTVTGAGGLIVSGPSTFSYATFNNASLTINAPTDINPGPGADVETAISCPMVNSSVITVHTGAEFIVNAGVAAINNGSWGFDSQSTLSLPSGSNQISFLNQGLLSFTNATLQTAFGATGSILSNAPNGTIYSVQTNTMNGPVASAGTIQTASNSVYQFPNNGTLSLFGGALVTGPGITFLNGSGTVNGKVIVTGGMQLFTDGANVGSALTINGVLEIGANGRFYWYGGAFAGVGTNLTGTVQVDQQGILYVINDANGLSIKNVILTNNGSVVWTNNGSISLANNAVIANNLNFYITGDSLLRPLPGDTSTVYFTNSGLVLKSGGSTNAQTSIEAPFYDGGTVHVSLGNIYFYTGGAINNFIVDSNCLINFSQGTYASQPAANVTATGTINFAGGAFINVPPSRTLSISGVFTQNGGIFYGSGQVILLAGAYPASYLWNAGTISITNQAGAFFVNAGAIMYIEGGSNVKQIFSGTLVNRGLIFWTNDVGGIALSNSAAISNNAGFYMGCDATMNDLSTDTNLASFFYNTPGSIVAKTAKTGTTTFIVRFKDSGNVLANSGIIEFANFSDNYPGSPLPTISLSHGTVQFDPSLVLHANVSGAGQITAKKPLTLTAGKMTVAAITLNGSVTNDETIDLGNFGVLTLAGTFTQTANGSLIVTLESTNAGGYSKVAGQGATVYLGGGIQAALAYGGAPPVGTSFPFLTAYQLFNTFSNVSLPQGMTVTYTGTGASIVVTNLVPVILEGYSLNGTNFGLQFATVSNEVYTIQYTTNFPPVWQTATNFTAETTNAIYSIPIGTNAVELFRVKASPGH